MNCEKGPTANPCGVCESCRALAEGGPGSIDVIELDAASHGGVDDTRDLRDRAFYAPARSAKRVFIIDEAHMVTTAGFNALLKIVEEPPPHLIFVFATTEPEKVLPTIRSRTHHYPFRLLPPKTLRELLANVAHAEQVAVEPDVYPLVIRASGGSPRDALSILDQLMAGAENATVTYADAVGLLGVTNAALIDSAVAALAAGDGAAVFTAVDQCVSAGGDPRRFAVDLLDRLRDLILVQTVPGALEQGLVDAPADAWPQRHEQARSFGPGTLARCAQTLHTGVTEMRGATSPRLLLEVVFARMLLPQTDSDALIARLERLERGSPLPAAVEPSPARRRAAEPGSLARSERAEPEPETPKPTPRAQPPAQRQEPETDPWPPRATSEPAGEKPDEPAPESAAVPAPEPVDAPEPVSARADTTDSLHEIWAKALGQIRERSRVAYALLEGVPTPELRGEELVIRQASSALAARLSDPKVLDMVTTALQEGAGVHWRVVCERGAAANASPSERPERSASSAPAASAAEPPSARARRVLAERRSGSAAREPGADPDPAPRREQTPPQREQAPSPDEQGAPQAQQAPSPDETAQPPDALALLTAQLGAKPIKG